MDELYISIVGDGGGSSSNSQMMMSDHQLKAQMANHPLYPNLLSACIQNAQSLEYHQIWLHILKSKGNLPLFGCPQIGSTDPELDQFMMSYCEVLHKYKDEVSKPFEEATHFLSSIESQLTHLCKLETLPSTTTCSYRYSDGAFSDEDFCCGELEANVSEESVGTRQVDEELKEQLMRKYGGYLCSLRGELSKKRRKGKLPKHATSALLEWWNTHYRWPYPTEDQKNRLSGITGLDLKQINNWFINQRKRHWRPLEDMQFALMEGVNGGTGAGAMYFDATRGVDI